MVFLPLCIEGTKGAGKTSTLKLLSEELTARDIEVETFAPFEAANTYAQSRGFTGAVEMIRSSKADNEREIRFIFAFMKKKLKAAKRKARRTDKPTVFIFDRGWVTLQAHLYNGQWFARDFAEPLTIDLLWQRAMQEAPGTIFLHASFEVTKQRRRRPDVLGGLDTHEKLQADVDGRVAFITACPDKIVLTFDTGITSQSEVVAGISRYIRDRLEQMPLRAAATRTPFIRTTPRHRKKGENI